MRFLNTFKRLVHVNQVGGQGPGHGLGRIFGTHSVDFTGADAGRTWSTMDSGAPAMAGHPGRRDLRAPGRNARPGRTPALYGLPPKPRETTHMTVRMAAAVSLGQATAEWWDGRQPVSLT